LCTAEDVFEQPVSWLLARALLLTLQPAKPIRMGRVTEKRTGIKRMATSVLWHGSQTEALELLQALSRNCSCVVTAEGVRLSTCAPHQMLSSDQRAIDGLLFARRIAARLRSEEFNPSVPSQLAA
jgi:hypothetical protein